MSDQKPYRIIISGGGTGGHIFPALAIANEFKRRYPDGQLLFVGAKGKMEMTRVPEAGYRIIGLWISGLQRSLTWSNVLVPLKFIVSYIRAVIILKRFKPHAVVGTGGYASAPVVEAASRLRIPSLIQEQNSYAGLVNKRVGSRVNKICVAYEGMEKYFPASKIVMTGNPVRQDILDIDNKRSVALNHFGFDGNAKTLLVMGGSQGARTINESLLKGIDKLIGAHVQIIWPAGKGYYNNYREQLKQFDTKRIRLYDFLNEIDLAYAAADVVISRAGALAVSELCVTGKPSILVPSPNVAEDHQTKNAKALSQRNAAILVTDQQAGDRLVEEALKLLFDEQRATHLSANIRQLAKPDATIQIVNEIEQLITKGAKRAGAGVNHLTAVLN